MSDGMLFAVGFGVSLFLMVLQIIFDIIFRKKNIQFSDLTAIDNRHGFWWYLVKPGLGYQEKYKWVAVAPTYIAITLFVGLFLYQVLR